MKRIVLLIVVLLALNAIKSYSTCPPGFLGTYSTSFVTCAGCSVTVLFCVRENSQLGFDDIYIDEIRYNEVNQGDCLCGASTLPGEYQGPAIEDIILGILNTREDLFGPVDNLIPCDYIDPAGANWKMRAFTGGCYEYTPPGYPNYFAKYTICNPYLLGECREYYKICKELVGGFWVRRVISVGTPIITFDCDNPLYEGDCVPICR